MTAINSIANAMRSENSQEAVCVVVTNGNRVLWQQRRDTLLWSLPGGMIENDESPFQAAIRELKEETNIDADDLTALGSDRAPSGILVWAFRYDFRTSRTELSEISNKNDPDEEARAFLWATPDTEEWAMVVEKAQHPHNVGLALAGLD
jgi:8-oxo-dGTP pyrophosphatase MutT (NUDIX family)